MLEVKPEVSTDSSIVWNVEGSDAGNGFKIGCYTRREARILAKALNDASYIDVFDVED